jgi:hypothetical protein
MSTPEKPNVEFDDPAKRPSLEDQGSSPAERAVLGEMGPNGMIWLVVAILVFLVVGGTVFFMFNR